MGAVAQLLATDINPQAAIATQQTLAAHGLRSAHVILTDLVTAFNHRLDGLVDVLIFNPPYVPTPDEEVELGGIAGMTVQAIVCISLLAVFLPLFLIGMQCAS